MDPSPPRPLNRPRNPDARGITNHFRQPSAIWSAAARRRFRGSTVFATKRPRRGLPRPPQRPPKSTRRCCCRICRRGPAKRDRHRSDPQPLTKEVGALLVNRPTGRFILRFGSAESKGCAPACQDVDPTTFRLPRAPRRTAIAATTLLNHARIGLPLFEFCSPCAPPGACSASRHRAILLPFVARKQHQLWVCAARIADATVVLCSGESP
jgi:hypothetical protein